MFRQPAQIWSSDGLVLQANSAFNSLFGLGADFDWESLNFRFTEDDQIKQAGAVPLIEKALMGYYAEIHSLDYIPALNPLLHNSRNEPLKLVVSLQPVHGSSDLTCIVCVVSDYMAGGELMEQQLIRSQKMENLETLANGIAHEFNNLLTGIKGMTSLIKDDVDPDSEVHQFASAIDVNIERGANLINQLLSYSRELPYHLKRSNIRNYLEESLPMLQLQLGKRIRIELNIEGNPEVMLDRHRMDQVLTNLLLNARNSAGNSGQILIRVGRETPHDPEHLMQALDWMCISVEDSGAGIRPEIYSRIFEPFFTTSKKASASGLGLSVANKIIKLHNGIMQPGSSELLGGAAMRVFLPTRENLPMESGSAK
jgi:signal transduction histidine kinase